MVSKFISYVSDRAKNYLSIQGILFLCTAFILMALFLKHTGSMFEYQTNMPMAVDPVTMENNIEYRQRIPYQNGKINDFQIIFNTFQRFNIGTLSVSLYKDDTKMQDWTVDTTNLVDGYYKKFEIMDPFEMDPSASYYIALKDTYEGENCVGFYTSNDANRIEYNGGRDQIKNKSFTCFLDVTNVDRQSQYQAVVLLFSIIIIIVTAFLLNPKDIKIPTYLLVIVCGFLCFRMLDYTLFQNLAKTEYIIDWQDTESTATIEAGSAKSYNVDINKSSFDTFRIYLEGENRSDIHVKMTCNDDGVTYFDRDIGSDEIVGDGRAEKTAINVYRQDEFPAGLYSVEIENTGNTPLVVSVLDDGELNFSAAKDTFLAGNIALCICFLLVLYLIAICVLSKHNITVEKWFLASAIPLALIYLVLFLPWSQPDTGSHMYATYRLSNMALGYLGDDTWKGRQEDAEFLQNEWVGGNPSLKDYEGVMRNAHLLCRQPEIVDLPASANHMAFYSVFNYLPQVIGLTIGRMLNLSTVASIYLGRIFILILYIAVIYRDIKKVPTGKWIITTIALLPMSLMMSSSISYDAMVIISTLSFITCILRLLKEKESRYTYLEAIFWAFIVGAIKGGGYLVLLPLVFVLLDKDNRKQSLYRMSGLIVAGLFSVLLFDKILPPSAGFQFGVAGNNKLSAAYALKEPLKYLDMAMSSYTNYFDALTLNTGGTALALLEETLPYALVALFMLLGGIQSIFENDEVELKRAHKHIFIFIIVIGLLTTPAMLLSWTDIGAYRIEGLQGRYYLPLLPLFIYAETKFSLHTPNKENYTTIMQKGIMWMTSLSCIFVYYMMTLYLTR